MPVGSWMRLAFIASPLSWADAVLVAGHFGNRARVASSARRLRVRIVPGLGVGPVLRGTVRTGTWDGRHPKVRDQVESSASGPGTKVPGI